MRDFHLQKRVSDQRLFLPLTSSSRETPDRVSLFESARAQTFRQSLATPDKMMGSTFDPESNEAGMKLKQRYYTYVKKIRKIEEKNKFFELKSSPLVNYIQQCNHQKIVPKPNGTLKKTEKQQSLNLKNYSLGDKYALALSKAIKSNLCFKEINLKENRLTDLGASSIVNQLSEDLKRLDLSRNFLGASSLGSLKKMMQTSYFCLEYLNLEHCKIGDKNFQHYFSFLNENTTVLYLNLAQNQLQDCAAQTLAGILEKNFTLERLDLH